MSRQLALDTICLRPTPRIAHTEYSMGYHTEYLAKLGQPFNDAWDIDLLWSVHDGPINWGEKGRATDMGHAVYAANGSDLHKAAPCPFSPPKVARLFPVWARKPTPCAAPPPIPT